jgi:hypothetical protein
MSVVTCKTPKGTIKGFLVTVVREGKRYRKNFSKTQEKKAIAYNEALLAKLPSIRRPNRYNKKPKDSTIPHVKGGEIQFFEKNGCVIYRSINETDRCNNAGECRHYNGNEGCLREVSKRNWPGFTNKPLKGGTK